MTRERVTFAAFMNGLFLAALAVAMLVPALLDFTTGNGGDALSFAGSGLITGLVAVLLMMSFRRRDYQPPDGRTVYLLTVTSWITVSAFGAIPLYLAVPGISVTDAMFESVSALTTTGATVLTGLDNMPMGLLMWRSLLQWLGGVGIIVMALSILPSLKIAGMQFFSSESSDISDKPFPKVRQLARAVAYVYLSLTGACILGLLLAGMPFFDAVNHAMATIATGGFSTKDASIGYYNSLPIEIVTEIFMVLGATPLAFYAVVLVRRNLRGVIDQQIPALLKILAGFILAATAWNISQGMDAGTALRQSAFNITSILTDTGFATTDFSTWGSFAVGLFFAAYLVGGCAGSTAGAIKVFRWQLLFTSSLGNFRRMLMPHALHTNWYQGRKVDGEVISTIRNFFFLYIMTLIVLSLVLMATGLDFLSATSSIAQGMANAGPGLGPIVGPGTNFAAVPLVAKWVIMLAMVLGRLELSTFYVVLMPFFWLR